MNILFVNDSPFNPIVGGIERVTDILAKELVSRGHNVYFLCGKIRPEKRYLLRYEYAGVLYELPNYGLFEDQENKDYYELLQDDLKINVVVNQRGLGGWFNSILPITHNKVISVIHSTPEGNINIFLNQLVELTSPPFVGLKKLIKRTFPFLFSYYWEKKVSKIEKKKYNDLAKHSSAIVLLSDKYQSVLKKFIDSYSTTRIFAIPNPNSFRSVYVSNEVKKKTVLYVGRLTKLEKEPMRLLRIWKRIYKEHPDWNLKIVGDGDEMQKMILYVKEHGLGNVYFEGEKSEVIKYYQDASIVCLTSNFEGWGMVLTEGMQYGCIPFTFNNYGAAYDIIDDGVNGFLIPAFDLRKYAKCMSELMSNESRRVRMSNAAIEKVKLFSVENVADKWENLLSLVLCEV